VCCVIIVSTGYWYGAVDASSTSASYGSVDASATSASLWMQVRLQQRDAAASDALRRVCGNRWTNSHTNTPKPPRHIHMNRHTYRHVCTYIETERNGQTRRYAGAKTQTCNKRHNTQDTQKRRLADKQTNRPQHRDPAAANARKLSGGVSRLCRQKTDGQTVTRKDE